MKKLNPLDQKILSELMKNARVSDRKIAKILGISQATVSRRRAKLEREVIDGYTVIPKWEKIGYEIFVLTLAKSKSVVGRKEKYDDTRKKGIEWLMKEPCVIMSGACEGAGINSFMISVHKNYSDFDDFMRRYRVDWGSSLLSDQPVLVNLAGSGILKPLHLKYLAGAK